MIVHTIELEGGYIIQGFSNDTVIEGQIYTPNNEPIENTFGFWNIETAEQQGNFWLKYNLTK